MCVPHQFGARRTKAAGHFRHFPGIWIFRPYPRVSKPPPATATDGTTPRASTGTASTKPTVSTRTDRYQSSGEHRQRDTGHQASTEHPNQQRKANG